MVELSEFDNDAPANDFRRANGAPLVRSVDGKRWDRYARPSGFGKDLDDEDALNRWRLDRAIEGVATTPSLAAAIAANIGRSEGRKERREKAISIGRGEEAADLGTALHAMAHRLETDPGFRAPEPYDADLAAYLTALDGAGLESVFCEVHLCSDAWRAAGTADRIYRLSRELRLPSGERIEPGTLVIGDLKTGKKLTYNVPGFAIQLAIYCDSVFYDIVTDERTPLPDNLHTGWGLLVHLPVAEQRCDLHWVDLESGREGARIVQAVRAWRKRDDFLVPFAFPDSDEVAVMSTPIFDLEQLDSTPPENDTEWVDAMLPWVQDRMNFIGGLTEPRNHLLRAWPDDVVPFRVCRPTASQLSRILELLNQIEAAYSLPFAAGDPRPEWNRGLHKSEVVRTNEPPAKESHE